MCPQEPIAIAAGPVGIAVGASAGGLAGLVFDLVRAGIDVDFLDEVSKALTPGKAAVLAEVQETWVTPVDMRLGKLGGLVFRRLRSEVVEDQLARESAAFDAELKQAKSEVDAKIGTLREQMKQAGDRQKAKTEKHIAEVKADYEVRSAKLEQAKKLIKEALSA